LKSTPNIYDTIKETNPINGGFGYTFVIEEINHFVYSETKEEAFNFVADYINEYYGKSKQLEQSIVRKKKVRKVQKDKRSEG
jgi:hypothetical protein